MSKKLAAGMCPLCHRYTRLTFHHLIPKKMHRRSFFRKHFTREQLNVGIAICRQCHNGIHRFYTEMELAKQYRTLEKLQSDEKLNKYFSWVGKQAIRL